jgi:hypothetical protein
VRNRTWLPKKEKSPPRPKVSSEIKFSVEEQAAAVVASLKKRCCKGQRHENLNWCVDILVRWHRDALYFVALMQTPHGRPPTFQVNVARMEHVGNGKFNVAVPMRRGWNTVDRKLSPEECLEKIGELIYL